ncbi:MAG: hypothetical protein ABR604_03955 [Jatrophihabitantaceae bacterium]
MDGQADGESLRPELARRSFLILTGGTLLAMQMGCTGGGGSGGEKRPPFPFDFWQGMQTAARSSSDHTRAAADRAVATRDVAAIFAFVRDQITLYPPPPGAYDPATAIRWGVDGTLRCGAGTLREKADVLAELCRRAGFQAEVLKDIYVLDPPMQAKLTAVGAYAPLVRTSDPKLNPDDVARWRKELGLAKSPGPRRAFDEGGRDSAAIAAAVLTALGTISPQTGDPAAPSGGPIVKVTTNGKTPSVRYAIPVAGLELLPTLRTLPTVAAGPTVAPKVTVAVGFTTTDAPDKPIEVISQAWTADQVVGRQVVLQFVPPFGIDDLLKMKVRDVNLFVPTLTLRRPGDDPATLRANVKTGKAITFAGDLVEEQGDAVTLGGHPVKVLDDAATAPAASRVATVKVQARALHFPVVELVVSALDAAGRPVDGLPARAFTVRDTDTPVAVLAPLNTAPAPRVLVIYDGSASVGAEFFSPAGKHAFARAFLAKAAAAVPGLELQVASTNGNPVPDTGWLAANPAAFEAALAQVGVTSGITRSVQAAKSAKPAVIVLITDGVDDEPNARKEPQLRADINRGAPVVAAAIATADKIDAAVLADLATLSGGTRVTMRAPKDVDGIVGAIVKLLGRYQTEPYRLTYDAPVSGPKTRTVTVATGTSVRASTTYEVPAVERRATAPALAGLHLTVTVGDETPVRRTLAGVPPDAPLDQPPPKDLASRLRDGLWGVTAISFEGAAPSMATWIDDHATGLLSARTLWQGAQRGDGAAMKAGLADGFALLPTELVGLHAPLLRPAPGDPLTFERLLRVAVITRHPRFGNPAGRLRRGDILPITSFDTTGADRAKALARTLRQSARLAVGERAVYDTSAAGLLDRAPLVEASNGLPTSFHLTDAQAKQWTRLLNEYPVARRLVPSSGRPLAFWAVDQRTGSLLGVLDDGSGGGRSASPRSTHGVAAPCVDELSDQAFNALGALGGGIYAIVGKACARIFARAARTLTTGPVPDTGDPNDILRDAACDLAKDAAFGGLGVDAIAGPIDDIADMFGKDLPCPGLSPTGGGSKPVC